MKHNPQYIDIEIDKLTNSVENVITGDCFQTDISLVDKVDNTLGAINVGGHLMVINTDAALKLIDKYFKK